MEHALLITVERYCRLGISQNPENIARKLNINQTRYYVILNPTRQLILQKAPTLVNPSRLKY